MTTGSSVSIVPISFTSMYPVSWLTESITVIGARIRVVHGRTIHPVIQALAVERVQCSTTSDHQILWFGAFEPKLACGTCAIWNHDSRIRHTELLGRNSVATWDIPKRRVVGDILYTVEGKA